MENQLIILAPDLSIAARSSLHRKNVAFLNSIQDNKCNSGYGGLRFARTYCLRI